MTKEELKSLMAAHGLNAKKTASMARVTPNCIYRWLNGTRKIPYWTGVELQKRLSEPGGKVLRLGDVWCVK